MEGFDLTVSGRRGVGIITQNLLSHDCCFLVIYIQQELMIKNIAVYPIDKMTCKGDDRIERACVL